MKSTPIRTTSIRTTSDRTTSGKHEQAQLSLVIEDRPWRLDDETRRIGRSGLAKARAVLAERNAALEAERAALELTLLDEAA